jgi:hypothetical protein
VGGVNAFWAVYASPPSDQTLPSETVLEASCHSLPGGQAYVHGGAMVGLWWIFFLFFSLFSLPASDFLPTLKKKCVLSFHICINFDPHCFDYYLFYFWCFLKFFFSIPSLGILFHLIFVSNLVLILFIAIFLFFSWFFFNFIPHHFV